MLPKLAWEGEEGFGLGRHCISVLLRESKYHSDFQARGH